MRKRLILIFLLLLFASSAFSQTENELITVIGDSLIGKVVDGESIREVIGDVVLKQGNVTVTCNRAIQYLASNEAELIGNVVAVQDSLTLKTERGFYYGNLRKTKSTSGITMDDMKVILSADSGEYFFDEHRAFFQTNVKLRDSITTLTSDALTYFKDEDRSVSVGNVKVVDNKSLIKADTLILYRKDKISYADGNVSINSFENNTTVYGDHLEDYGKKKYTLINENPLMMQIDTTTSETDSLAEMRIDTLMIKCKVMEGYRDTTNLFKAIDSVIIIRGDFASVNDFTLYYRNDEQLITEKISESAPRPVLWYGSSQLTGDSVTIYLENGQMKKLDVINNSFMLSQNKNYPQRFDQTSSENIHLYFGDNKLNRAEFDGKVQSIYYLYDDEKSNGLTKSTAQDMAIVFENNEVLEVRLYGIPNSEYYPEAKIVGLERTFTLPKFVFNENRPSKQKLISGIK